MQPVYTIFRLSQSTLSRLVEASGKIGTSPSRRVVRQNRIHADGLSKCFFLFSTISTIVTSEFSLLKTVFHYLYYVCRNVVATWYCGIIFLLIFWLYRIVSELYILHYLYFLYICHIPVIYIVIKVAGIFSVLVSPFLSINTLMALVFMKKYVCNRNKRKYRNFSKK